MPKTRPTTPARDALLADRISSRFAAELAAQRQNPGPASPYPETDAAALAAAACRSPALSRRAHLRRMLQLLSELERLCEPTR